MVTFDARTDGTSAERWEADARWDGLPSFDWGDADEVVVVSAHPDDETLAAGGLLAAAADRGLAVRIIVVTDGAASHAGVDADRAAELAAALAILAPHAIVSSLGLPDSGVSDQAFICRALLEEELSVVSRRALLVTPWSGDGHGDHRVVGMIVRDIADGRRVLAMPIWMWHWATPDDDRVPWHAFRALRVDPDRKRHAILAHASQIRGTDPQLRPAFLEHFLRDVEVFIEQPRSDLSRHFDATHARASDPWGTRDRHYELRKRAITLASLPRERYANALEIGCSIGTLTEELAPRVDRMTGMDVSGSAIDAARSRGGAHGIRWVVGDARRELPGSGFDLVVLSEVAYYWDLDELDAVLDAIERNARGGHLLACHWLPPVPDGPLTGRLVHERIAARGWTRLVHHDDRDFVLDVLEVPVA